MAKISTDVLVTYEPEDLWIAHSLHFDIMASGDNPGEARGELRDLVELYIEACASKGLGVVEMFRFAPPEYWWRYQQIQQERETYPRHWAQRLGPITCKLSFDLPRSFPDVHTYIH